MTWAGTDPEDGSAACQVLHLLPRDAHHYGAFTFAQSSTAAAISTQASEPGCARHAKEAIARVVRFLPSLPS